MALSGQCELWITVFFGLDDHYVDQDAILIDKSKFQSMDLREPLELNRRFDIVIKMEITDLFEIGVCFSVNPMERHPIPVPVLIEAKLETITESEI
jgi:hypothetical protein